jgi:hypothetical protein
MDQCGSETLDTFLHNVSLFRNKIPHKFAGYRSTVNVIFVNIYLMLTDNYTDSYELTLLRFTGMDVKFISLAAEDLNLTLNYRICGERCRVGEDPYIST